MLHIVALLLALPVSPAFTAPVEGAETIALDAAAMGALPRHRVTDLLQRAGLEVGRRLRGQALAQCLGVEGRDGYRALDALTELDPDFTDEAAIVVRETRAARGARHVTALHVRRAP